MKKKKFICSTSFIAQKNLGYIFRFLITSHVLASCMNIYSQYFMTKKNKTS